MAETEIPEDIRRTVARMLEYGEQDRNFTAVVRAILAERERCAKIAESQQWAGDPSPGLELRNSVCLEIDAAIRNPSP